MSHISNTANSEPASVPADEEQLFRDLVHQHSHRLQRFIMRQIGNATEAEDLAQQAFVEAALSYRNFRGESRLSTWLYGIALNLVRNHLSRAPERRYQFVDDESLSTESAPGSDPEEIIFQQQKLEVLQEAMAELPEHMQQILLMVGLEDISYEEAAVMLTIPIGTVRSRLSRAREALRKKALAKGLVLE